MSPFRYRVKSLQRTFTVSFPTPALPPTKLSTHAFSIYLVNAPVTRMTLPVRSGISLTPQIGLGGKDCTKTDNAPPIVMGREIGWEGKEEWEGGDKGHGEEGRT